MSLAAISFCRALEDRMLTVHDVWVRAAIVQRLERLHEDLRPQWGSFSCAAMLYHLNAQMKMALGELAAEPVGKASFWHTQGKAIALSDEPWPEGAPTSREALPSGPVEFVAEREQFRMLLERLAARDCSEPWPDSARLGPMRGEEWSRLTYTHIRHHFRQFGVWSEP
jgi:hypothetical protein